MNTPLLTDRTCLTCKHKVISPDGEQKQFFCRRNPPTASVLLVPGPEGRPVTMTFAAFPPVQPEMFCGEWAPRIIHGHASALA